MGDRLAVHVTSDAVGAIRRGSPWLFDRSIVRVDDAGHRSGDLAVIFDSKRRFTAIGLWDPDSPIRVKILHHGSPVSIDRDFWRDRLRRSIDRRGSLDADRRTTAYRLIHGENDGFPALVVDRYGDSLVIKVYSAAWFAHLPTLVELLVEELEPERIVLRTSRRVTRPDDVAEILHGERPTAPVWFTERGLALEADLLHGHKTGHFLDQRDNRALLATMTADAEVLDLFSHTGGFALAAAAGGARRVHLVDTSRPALESAARAFARNRSIAAVARCEMTTEVGDVFAVLDRLADEHRTFDVVVVDPPSFTASAGDERRALDTYRRLARLAVDRVRPGGLLVQCSCSSRVSTADFVEAVRAGIEQRRRTIEEIRVTGHGIDHPIGFEYGAYLKALFIRVG